MNSKTLTLKMLLQELNVIDYHLRELKNSAVKGITEAQKLTIEESLNNILSEIGDLRFIILN